MEVSFVMLATLLAAGLPGATVVKPVANMYSQPTDSADVVSQAIYGSHVGIVEEREGWAKVRTADEYTGWMPLSALRNLKAGEKPYASTGRVAQVQSLFANIYREPDVTKHQPLVTAPFETRLEVIAEPRDDERWLEVRLPDDRPGWVQRGDVSFDLKPLSIAETIAVSRRFLGLPYVWGGVSTFGFDCSGFTQMLCRKHGVLIPRDTGPQARWSGVVAVERKDLKPGDLLYFGKSAAKITHTGMYIGDGKFINATTYIRPVVQICELNDPHWSELLVACRRLR